MDKARIQRIINHFYTKLKASIYEKKHKSFGTRVKYMFYPQKESDTLLVSFPACAPNTAKYNYMRSLSTFKCNKLFLLDDFGSNHQGCYLIEDNVEKCTKELIDDIVTKCKDQLGGGKSFKNIIFLGSSKGGYSALNFSLMIPDVIVVIGAPQYRIGSYLDYSLTLTNLSFIIGDITEEKKRKLDNRLVQKIATTEILPKAVYFHYSNVEHTYKEHVKDMIRDLKNAGIHVIEDVQDYPEHSGLATAFPPYLERTIKALLK